MLEAKTLDYYEFLQISPHADSETIHRVYKFLAARFHPDNPESGDPERFFLLKAAYDVLSDPDRRTAYDADYLQHAHERHVQEPLSNSVDFLDHVQGEMNRRMAVLAVLYYRRRSNPFSPEVGLAEIEKRMGFPRDYLDFTTWYLAKKGYITRADNSDFALTADGVDFVETQRVNMPVLNKLLTNGNTPCSVDSVDIKGDTALAESHTVMEPHGAHFVLLNHNTQNPDRRRNGKDRRVGAPDLRANQDERRTNQRSRRTMEQNPITGTLA